MRTTRIHVWAFIVLVLASCVGCARDEYGGCSCPFHRPHVIVETIAPPHMDSASQVSQPGSGNQLGGDAWQDLASLGPNKTSSGISARDTAERSDERDRKY